MPIRAADSFWPYAKGRQTFFGNRGASGIDGLVVATGHHRNGILLTPVSAAVMSDYILSGRLPEMALPFAPQRFAERRPAPVAEAAQ